MTAAIKIFDDALPQFPAMRNVGEHLDDYAVDSQKRRHKEVCRQMLQVGTWDGVTYKWLGKTLNIDAAHDAAYQVYSGVKKSIAL